MKSDAFEDVVDGFVDILAARYILSCLRTLISRKLCTSVNEITHHEENINANENRFSGGETLPNQHQSKMYNRLISSYLANTFAKRRRERTEIIQNWNEFHTALRKTMLGGVA